MLLWFSTTMMASFLLSISVFLLALSTFFTLSENYAGALAATVAALLFSWVGTRTLGRDESVRMFGLVISIGGLLAVAAIIVSGQFFRIGLLDSPDIQNGSLGISVYFLLSALTFGIDWKKITSVPIGSPNIWVKFLLKAANTPWLAGLFFLSTVWDVSVTRDILRRVQGADGALVVAGSHVTFLPSSRGLDRGGSNKRPLFDAHTAGFGSRAKTVLISMRVFRRDWWWVWQSCQMISMASGIGARTPGPTIVKICH
jgi:hypothetical protein